MLGCQSECQSRRYPDAPSRPPRTVGGLLAELGLFGPIRTTPITGILRRANARGVEEEMQQLSSSMSREPLTTLAIGVVAVALGLILRDDHPGRYAVLLLGTWLLFGALIRYVASHAMAAPEPLRWIPIRFSGDLGRFELRSRGDGRRVEVRTGEAVVAELIASDEGDELVVDFGLADDPDVDDFGAAIGLAIEMVAAADEDLPARRELVGPPASASSPGLRRGSLLRRLRRV